MLHAAFHADNRFDKTYMMILSIVLYLFDLYDLHFENWLHLQKHNVRM